MRRSIVMGEFYSLISTHNIHLFENINTAVRAFRTNDVRRVFSVHSNTFGPSNPKRTRHDLLQLFVLREGIIRSSNGEQYNE